MPVQAPQVPGFWLPGTEYFNLSPNATVALQGRRRRTQNLQGIFTAGTTGVTFGQLQIESPFVASSGIYIHWMSVAWAPVDTTGEVTIGQASVGFSMAAVGATPPAFVGLPIGLPTQTNVNPISTQNIIVVQDLMLTGNDILLASGSAPGALFWQLALGGHNNDPTNPHTVNMPAFLIYTRLDGIIE